MTFSDPSPTQGGHTLLRGRQYEIKAQRMEGADLLFILESAPPDRLLRMRDARLAFRAVASVAIECQTPDPLSEAPAAWKPVTVGPGKLVGWVITRLEFADGRAVVDLDERREEGPIQSGFDTLAIACAAVELKASFSFRRNLIGLFLTWPVIFGAMMAFLLVFANLINSPAGRLLFDMFVAPFSLAPFRSP